MNLRRSLALDRTSIILRLGDAINIAEAKQNPARTNKKKKGHTSITRPLSTSGRGRRPPAAFFPPRWCRCCLALQAKTSRAGLPLAGGRQWPGFGAGGQSAGDLTLTSTDIIFFGRTTAGRKTTTTTTTTTEFVLPASGHRGLLYHETTTRENGQT